MVYVYVYKKLSQNCHPDPERAVGESNGEGSGLSKREILRCAQNDVMSFEIVYKNFNQQCRA